MPLSIRTATVADVPTLMGFIKALAEFENLAHEVKATEDDLRRDGFGAVPRFEARIAELDGRPAGFALFFASYSTFEGRPSLFLEDLFVLPDARAHGVGRRLIADLAALALSRGWQRLDLSVLDWNPARGFYERLGFEHIKEWLPQRLSGAALRALAAEAAG